MLRGVPDVGGVARPPGSKDTSYGRPVALFGVEHDDLLGIAEDWDARVVRGDHELARRLGRAQPLHDVLIDAPILGVLEIGAGQRPPLCRLRRRRRKPAGGRRSPSCADRVLRGSRKKARSRSRPSCSSRSSRRFGTQTSRRSTWSGETKSTHEEIERLAN
ncbi:MAG: hypothetical protein ACRDJY_10215 [Thermoleophilaceae bacterium]